MESSQAHLDDIIPRLSVVPPTEAGSRQEESTADCRSRALSSASNFSQSSYHTAFEFLPGSPLQSKFQMLLPLSSNIDRRSRSRSHEPDTPTPQSPSPSESSPYFTANPHLSPGSQFPLIGSHGPGLAAETPPHTPTSSEGAHPALEIHVSQASSSHLSSGKPGSMANGIRETDYERYVRENSLNTTHGVLVPGWSGRGKHVTYPDVDAVNAALPYVRYLGHGSFGTVESVKCPTREGTALLVRKNMRRKTGKHLLDFMDEVRHSSRFKHKHLIQFVGTYSTRDTLALLQYPAGEDTLKAFMENHDDYYGRYRPALKGFVKCLANALRYLHKDGMAKHMDIKAENVIVKRVEHAPYYTVFIIDFGLTRKVHSQGVSHSSGTTGFTREYAAPEVVPDPTGMQDVSHTRRSDVFSLGCVFAEMATVATSKRSLADFRKHRNEGNDKASSAFSATLPKVEAWLDILESEWTYEGWGLIIDLIRRMLQVNPRHRPKSQDIVHDLGAENCCQEVFEDNDAFWEH